MADRVRILGIAGSLRRDSYNRMLLRQAGQLLPPDSTLDTFDLAGIPVYNQDDDPSPPARVQELRRMVRAADALLFVTPEHNFSVPAALKNVIDWLSRPPADNAWAGKPAAIMGASYGRIGTARAQAHLRQIFSYIDIHPINKPIVMIGEAFQAFDADGNLKEEKARDLVRQLMESLVAWTLRIQGKG